MILYLFFSIFNFEYLKKNIYLFLICFLWVKGWWKVLIILLNNIYWMFVIIIFEVKICVNCRFRLNIYIVCSFFSFILIC